MPLIKICRKDKLFMKKKTLFVALLSALSISTQTFAYDFPEPDWGAILRERTAMVKETDFELYTEGSVNSAPYYGAKFEPRGGTYIGMNAERAVDFKPLASYLTYIQEMQQNDMYWPAKDYIASDNVIATIGWTVTNSNVDYNHIRNVLDRLSTYGKPMFIRFASEMDQWQIGDDPDLYKQIFKNVSNMIHEYPNLAVVWSPLDLGALNRPFQYYYPGDEYVDWIGVSCYTKKFFLGNQNTSAKDAMYFMTGDGAWATNKLKPLMKFLSDYKINKPVMISEGGVAVANKFGESLEYWSRPRLKNMLWSTVMKYPQIKLVNYFNVYRSDEAERFNIDDKPYACDIFRDAAENGPFIRSYNGSPAYSFAKASAGETIKADNSGLVQLYTLAYIYQKPDITVNYFIDGEWYSSSSEIPYKTHFIMSRFADGIHKVEIKAAGLSKTYNLYKSGNYIRFGAEPILPPEPAPAAPVDTEPVKVVVNRSTLQFDQPPIIVDGRTLVPLRAIFEALDAKVEWDDLTQSITSTRNGDKIVMQIDSKKMYVNGAETTLDVSPCIVNDHTLIPVRAVAEAFDCTVRWDGDTRTVYISQ